MNLNSKTSLSGTPWRPARAYTLVELLVAITITVTILSAAMAFLNFAAVTMSGITAQTAINDQAANALQLLQSRARLATSVSNSSDGMTLTLGFDDNYQVDKDGDGLAYNDTDHVETFQIVGSSTNVTSSTNSLVYNSTNGFQKVLVPSGVCKLPGRNIFTITNQSTALIRFAIVDAYTLDRYQSIDIQSTAVILNRRLATNVISVIP